MTTKRIKYLDSIKGIACVLVFLGHFCYGFYGNIKYDGDIWTSVKLFNTVFYIFLNGVFPVSIFALISGYLSVSEVKRVRDVLYIALKRYIRLMIPIFFTCVFIYILSKTVTFKVSETAAETLNNPWLFNVATKGITFLGIFKISIFDVLIKGDLSVSSPLWMMRPLLVGQILFTVFCYIESKKHRTMTIVSLILFVIGAGVWQYPCLAVLLGGLYKKYNNKFNLNENIKKRMWIIMPVVTVIGMLLNWCPNVSIHLPLHKTLEISSLIKMVLAASFLLSIKNTELVKTKLENNVMLHFGKLSLPIYLIHMPIITTLSCTVLLRMINNISYASAYALTFVVTVVAVYIIAELWSRTVDRIGDYMYRKVNVMLQKLLV